MLKGIFKKIIILCILCLIITGCEQQAHYDTFDELLASEERADIPDEEREICYTFRLSYRGPLNEGHVSGSDYRHLNEYDHLSDNVAELAGKECWWDGYGTWYYPEGGENGDILIFISKEGTATVWERIIIGYDELL